MDGQPDKAEIIGERLRALRIASDYARNQKGFAELCGITSQAWNNWERGRQTPSLEQVSKIRRVTHVTTDFIYFGDFSGLTVDLAAKIRAAMREPNQERA